MLAPQTCSGALCPPDSDPFAKREADMTGAIPYPSYRLRPLMAAICVASLLVAPIVSGPALARGPDGIADVAEKVIDAVVNISTSQTVDASKGGSSGGERGATPQLPPGSPFE